jgi:hypothetical protein
MTKIKLTTERFQELLNSIIADIQRVQRTTNDYGIEFNESGNTAYITQSDNFPFYVTYLDTFTAILTLYECSMWFDVRNGKPCLVFINEG